MKIFPELLEKYTFIRYAFVGGFSSFIDITLLYVLTHFLGIYYLSSAVLAMTTSFIIRFLLQKTFAFRDKEKEGANRQLFYYSTLYLFSMIMTTSLLYLFVEIFGLWYMTGQIIAIGCVATISFFVYRHIIFPKTQTV